MFTVRDLCWLTLVVCIGLGMYKLGVSNEFVRIETDIDNNGYYYGRQWKAVLFPLRDERGRPTGTMMRVYLEPSLVDGEKVHTAEVHYVKPDVVMPYYIPIRP